MSALDLQGKKFGRLTVIEKAGKDKARNILWKCKCDCGNYLIIKACDIKRGHSVSCGCYQKERASEANKIHGKSNTKLHYVWTDMLKRCENPKHHAYKWYGGKGVKVCDEWKEFVGFEKWALENGYKAGLTIDRIDGNGDYCPQNCRWATRKQQSNNLSTCVFFEFMGERLNITQFCEKYSVSPWLFYSIARKNICEKTLMDCIERSKSKK